MAEENTGKLDMSAYALEQAKTLGFGTDAEKFKKWETDLIRKIYEVIGLADIPEEFLNFTSFIDAYSGVLVKSVQNDLAIMNLTKRLAMFKLSGEIQAAAQKDGEGATAPEAKPFVPPFKSTPPPGEG